MKKLGLLLWLFLLANISLAQTFTPDIVKGRVTSKSLKAVTVDSTADRFKIVPNITVQMKMRTPALQLTFTQVQKINEEWRLTTPIYVGYSYIFSYANGVIHQDSSITVENRFFFGGGFNLGVVPDPQGELIGSVPVGVIIGYSRYGLFGGVNVLDGKPLVGVSINLLNFPALQGLTRFNLE
jgi:hypothetical protein